MNIQTRNKMNRIEQYLKNYQAAYKTDNDNNWEKFLNDNENLSMITKTYFNNVFKFLPENQTLDFHDAYVIGNVKPDRNNDTFNITMRLFCYEKKDDNSYHEVDPIYVEFTIDNKFRAKFHKLSVKSSSIMAVVFENQNMGIVYLNNVGDLKTMYVENIDLSNNKVIQPKFSKKLGI